MTTSTETQAAAVELETLPVVARQPTDSLERISSQHPPPKIAQLESGPSEPELDAIAKVPKLDTKAVWSLVAQHLSS